MLSQTRRVQNSWGVGAGRSLDAPFMCRHLTAPERNLRGRVLEFGHESSLSEHSSKSSHAADRGRDTQGSWQTHYNQFYD